MTNQYPQLAIRTAGSNPDHHLWNNNGTWWLHYTVYPDAIRKERVRRSLRTHDLWQARALRDAILGSAVEHRQAA